MDNNSDLGGGDLDRGSVFTVPDSNDWYLTTDDIITLGPYRSYQEAVSLLGLLRNNPDRG